MHVVKLIDDFLEGKYDGNPDALIADMKEVKDTLKFTDKVIKVYTVTSLGGETLRSSSSPWEPYYYLTEEAACYAGVDRLVVFRVEPVWLSREKYEQDERKLREARESLFKGVTFKQPKVRRID